MHEHIPVNDRYNNLVCFICGKIFARIQPQRLDYEEYRTDAYREI